jgi:hypothetical protein
MAVLALTIALALALIVAVPILALAQYYVLFLRKRFVRTVEPPSPSAFLDRIAVSGDGGALYVHSLERFVIRVRHAIDPAAPSWESEALDSTRQTARYDHWRGCGWDRPFALPVAGLDDGPHIVEVATVSGRTFRTPMIVRRRAAAILVVCATNTWHAYNAYGGLSNYDNRAVPIPLRWALLLAKGMNARVRLTDRVGIPETPLPLARPMTNLDEDLHGRPHKAGVGISHLHRAELALMRALAKLGLDYAVITDDEVADGALEEASVRLVLFPGHSEYWSEAGMGALAARAGRPGGIGFLSGNNLYRVVDRHARALVVTRQTIDPDEAAQLLGAGSDSLGYLSFAGYRVTAPQHWIFDGAQVSVGALFGAGDGTPENPGASGFETDKTRRSTPPDATILAVGQNREGGASFVCRDLAPDRFIVNVGSVSFTSACADTVIERMLLNMAHRAGVR